MSKGNYESNAGLVYDLTKLNREFDVIDLMKEILLDPKVSHDSFYVADLDEIYNRHLLWKKNFPRIEPLYAVKANYDSYVLKMFRHMGIGFDCSSKNEIKRLIKMNISGDRILYANPIKQISDIKFANRQAVRALVFDNECELEKIKTHYPTCELYLRIRVDSLAAKFGADRVKAQALIRKCVDLDLNLVGISFYVGFRQTSAANIIQSIRNAKYLFDYARSQHNYIINELDIGGGFPGTWQSVGLFEEMAAHINTILDECFPDEHYRHLCQSVGKKFKIIAELGTFYTSSSYNLCVNIIAKRELDLSEQDKAQMNKTQKIYITGKKNGLITDEVSLDEIENTSLDKKYIYFINDSAHASFKWFTLNETLPVLIRSKQAPSAAAIAGKQKSTFYLSNMGGCTCDSSDFIIKDCFMPELSIGDFLIFRNTGSYNKTGALAFNDIKLPCTIFVSSKYFDSVIREALFNKKLNENDSYNTAICRGSYSSDDEDELKAKNVMEKIYKQFKKN